MSEEPRKARDYSDTLFLPKTDFPMRAGLPQREPEILARWSRIDLYGRLRAAAKGRPRFILHDGPPYANGNIHIGHALNKILKDVVTRSQQMLGFDSNYVPGWDCHGLPIEWKIEEENYRARGKPKPDLSNAAAVVEFRQECRAFAAHWIKVQSEEFQRLGVVGDWAHPYTTMDFYAEAQIARELMKFAANGTLYRGSKPVMWSVVEKTALAEAEIEYEDYVSDTVWVKFPVAGTAGEAGQVAKDLRGASIVIWTTTPWTIPGNRAISYSPRIEYGLYQVTDAPSQNWATPGDFFILADKLALDVLRQARVTAYKRIRGVKADELANLGCAAPTEDIQRRLRIRGAVTRRRSRHRRDRHRLRPHRARPRARGFRCLDCQRIEACGARHQHRHSLHRRRRRPLHRTSAGLYRQACAHRQRREGRCQRGGDQGLDRRRHADRARAPEASISAFVAIEEAGDLSQHAAMVHRHGSADRVVEREREGRPHVAAACA